MKLAVLALLASVAALQAAPAPPQMVERSQKAAVQKHPALGQAGSPLNRKFLAIVAMKRTAEPQFFDQPDWPLRAADAAAAHLRAEEGAAQASAAAEMKRTEAEREKAEEISEWEKKWEAEKARWIFDRLVFGDSEEAIVRKLSLSKIVSVRAKGERLDLNSRFRWVLGESKFNLAFEMKDGLAAITFECLPMSASELEGLIREDWDKLRAAALEQLGPPTKSSPFPTGGKVMRGGWTVTDAWTQPGREAALGLSEEGGRCHAILRLGDPGRGMVTPKL